MQGRIEVFTAGGKLLKKFTVSHTSVAVAKVFGTLVWLGLHSGKLVAIDTVTHQRCAVLPVHDTAIQDLQQVPLTVSCWICHVLETCLVLRIVVFWG